MVFNSCFVMDVKEVGGAFREIAFVGELRLQLVLLVHVDIGILDMPLLDTRIVKGIMGTFTADLVLFFPVIVKGGVPECHALF